MTSITLPWHVKTDTPYIPSIPGEYFHKSKAPVKLFGGAVGGTKTTSLATDIIYLSLKYPYNRGFAGERDFDDLRRGLYSEIMDWLPPSRKLADGRDLYIHNKSEHWLKFYNGSEIHFVELKDEPRNVNLGWAAIDQAERVPEKSYEWLETRLRLENVDYRPILLSANPEPGWVFRQFVQGAVPEDTGIKRRNGEPLIVYKKGDALFVPSFPADNPHLPSDYEARLLLRLSPTRVERLLKGVWEVVENAIYELDRATHLRPIPSGTVFVRSTGGADYGTEHLSAVATVSKALDGSVWVREVWADKTADIEIIKQEARHQEVSHKYSSGRTDPLQAVLAQHLGWSTAIGRAGSRKDRIALITRLMNARNFYFDIDGHGVREAFEEALAYHYERRETETIDQDVVVRKGEDRVAAIEYAVEEMELGLDYTPPVTHDIKWRESQVTGPNKQTSKARRAFANASQAIGYRLGR